jgi:hypothetical protein
VGDRWGCVGVVETVVGMRGEDVGGCQTLLHNFFLQVQSSDTWQWQPNILLRVTQFVTPINFLTSQDLVPLAVVEDLV